MPAPILTAVFNVTDAMGSIPGLYADGTHATDNTTNLNNMIAALLTLTGPTNGKGGTLEFPSAGTGSYAFDGTINIGQDDSSDNEPFQIILRGDGAQARSAPLLQQTESSADFFVVNNRMSGDTTHYDQIARLYSEDLMLSFSYSEGQTGGGRGIVVTNGSNVRIQRVTFDGDP